ncbi:hypothetical protein PR048_018413 [Dryococelus australis]|uniref:Uncharacterized protein n=1 Tax=Dryococelus australis TaxID=614101 RepID=A0ABQ9HC76_9NEOP|nr:hypothetical protein PR048_018413 [Dryococelus australis]
MLHRLSHLSQQVLICWSFSGETGEPLRSQNTRGLLHTLDDHLICLATSLNRAQLFPCLFCSQGTRTLIPKHWHFIPPAVPHSGGLWDAGMKTLKVHLSKVISTQILIFKKLYSHSGNQRHPQLTPYLSPMSTDSQRLVLTSGHFLTGKPLKSLPERDLGHLSLNTFNL